MCTGAPAPPDAPDATNIYNRWGKDAPGVPKMPPGCLAAQAGPGRPRLPRMPRMPRNGEWGVGCGGTLSHANPARALLYSRAHRPCHRRLGRGWSQQHPAAVHPYL